MTYSTAIGVRALHTTAHPGGTLADLREQHRKPMPLDTPAITYHNLPKKARGDVKKALPYFVGGELKGRRSDSAVVSRTLLTLDIEAVEGQAVPPTPQEALAALKRLGAEGWVYTSISHTPAAPRYRVVLPLGKPITGSDLTEEVLEATTKAAAKKLGLADWCRPESYVLSQPMYLPAKLKGGTFWEGYTDGKGWRTHRPEGVAEADPAAVPVAPSKRLHADPVVDGLLRLGVHLGENPRQKGMHWFRCPMHEAHQDENDTKTVYYEAGSHTDAADRLAPAGCKCMSTSHEPLTLPMLKDWLRRELGDAYRGYERLADFPDLTPGQRKRRDRLTAQSPAEFLDYDPPPWLIEGLIPRGEGALIQGQSGAGKSFFALDIACRLACGMAWQGRTVPSGLWVAYIAAEGAASLRKRLLAWCAHHGKKPGDLRMVFFVDTPSLAVEADCVRIVEQVLDATNGAGVAAFVTDTMARATAGVDENSSAMSVPLGNLQGMRRATGGTPITVHHLGKDAERGGRGWSGIRADMDTVLEVTAGEVRMVRVDKQRDGEEGARYGFTLEAVGDAAVVSYCDAPQAGVKAIKGEALRLFNVLEDMKRPAPVDKVLDAYVESKLAEFKASTGKEHSNPRALRAKGLAMLEAGIGGYEYDEALGVVTS